MRKEGKIWHKAKGGVPEIVGMVAQVDSDLSRGDNVFPFTLSRSEKTLEGIYNYVLSNVKYKRDGAEELIKYPARTIRDGFGDCKSMSILIASGLKAAGIPYKYRFTYTDKNSPLAWHVYPIASIGGKDYIMDAVIKKFNKEHPYVQKFDYYPKSIAAVSGVNGGVNGVEIVPQKNYIDTFRWTGGEVTAALIYEQLNILGTDSADKELIKDALFLGVNDTAGVSKIKRIKNQQVRAALMRAAKDVKTNSALPIRRVGISDPLIPLEDCGAYVNAAYGQNNPAEVARCEAQNRYKRMLNEHLEDSAHHLLYEYVISPNAAPATVAAKKVLHTGVIDSLATITGLSRNNLRLWIRNGTLRNNAKRGAGALQPEETIPALKQAVEQGVGGLPAAVIVAIISAISAAVAGTLQLIAQMNATEQAKIRATAATIGQPNFGPLKSDWETAIAYQESAGNEEGRNNNLIAIAALAAGVMLIK